MPRTTFARGFRVEAKVVGALLMRELHTRYGRENIGYIWLILEPMLLAVAITLLHSRAPTEFGTDMKPVPFSLVGYCNFIMFRGIFNRSEGALEPNLPLLYHRNVTIFDVMLARALLEAAASVFVFALLMGLAIAAGLANLPERPLFLLLGIAAMFLLSFGLGLIVVTISHDNRSVGRLVHPVGYLMLPLSGVFTVVSWLPRSVQDALYWIPLTHVFELLRYGQFRSAGPDFIDPYYLGAWIGLTLLAGLLSISVLRGKIHMP